MYSRTMSAILCVVCVVALLVPQSSLAARTEALARLDQLAGADRYETASAIARAAYPDGCSSVVLTTGQAWPDAVGGSALAGAVAAPILLTTRWTVPATTRATIQALSPDTVYVLGGERAISDRSLAVIEKLGIDADDIVRIAGRDRYATASRVASATLDLQGTPSGHAFVTTGRNFADALSIGPVAAATADPVYLTDPGRYEATIDSIKAAGITDVTLLGGAEAVSDSFAGLLMQELGGSPHVDRIGGATRFSTATRIAEFADRELGFGYERVGVATGYDWADAASCGPYLALRREPLILVAPHEVPDSVSRWIYHRVAAFTVFGGSSAVPSHVRQEAVLARATPPFEVNRAMGHVRAIAALGARPAGGSAEGAAFDYIADELRDYGYVVSTQTIYLPGGKTSRDVIAEKRGSESGVLVLGAHVDSKSPSPGANDNASGVAVMLELARLLAQAPVTPTVRFIAFGAEEISGATANDHHFGSKQYVSALSSSARSRIQGMVSIDMVGYGSTFNVRSLGVGPQSAVRSLESRASYVGQRLVYLRDPGWSDHDSFELAGIPSAWLEWRDDPVYHTTSDTASHVQPSRVRVTGRLLRGWILGMSVSRLDLLR